LVLQVVLAPLARLLLVGHVRVGQLWLQTTLLLPAPAAAAAAAAAAW
jgi:hypothetical protein